ncbi:Retrotransposon gag protein [Corchorus olitorius]|uniref:Retrotransposon gag protein n=1 Tax=Corchorus olitorius TaxID=93759 RepID=A0A1R3GSI9_9ROSI|nr:Retrotransposon gag protein [Corchorus olitorius]
MTRRTRKSPSSSSQFSAKSSATRSKHHHKIPREKSYYYSDDDDNVDTSLSHYPIEILNQMEMMNWNNRTMRIEDDYDNEVDASEYQSESMANDPKPSNNGSLGASASSNSITNSEIWTQSHVTEAISSYINIAPFPIFRGGPNECPVTHLSRFAKVCRANNVSSVDMMMRIFPITLEDEAGIWYDLNIEPYPSLSWEEIKSSFLQAYNKTQVSEQLRHELTMINQGSEECVRSYFLRLQWSLRRWPDHGIPETLIKEIFVDGLKEDFQDWIIPQKPDSLAEALRLAFAYEQVKNIKLLRKKDLKCDFCGGQHEERSCLVREKMKGLWQRAKDKQLIDSSSSLKKDESNEEVKETIDGDEEGEMMLNGKKKKSQCQCSKHRCWKKQLQRSSSLISRNSDLC